MINWSSYQWAAYLRSTSYYTARP